ncbi:MAG: hypothetical protein Q9195_009170 [Heterodermia aff. obscurata]
MADDIAESDDERATELATLAAIYPELVLDSSDPYSASIHIPVEPIEPLAILFPTVVDGVDLQSGALTPPASDDVQNVGSAGKRGHASSQPEISGLELATAIAQEVAQEEHLLSHLPPLHLRISLPNGYPTTKPPVFHLETSLPWLPEGKLKELREAGHCIWEDMGRDQVVYSYMDHLREAAENAFGLTGETKRFLEVPQNLKIALMDFDLKAKRAKFEAETFECGVCIEPKKGANCHRLLLCGHVFCVECLQDCFNTCISEGDVGQVKCMATRCDDHPSKDDPTLDPSELLQIPLSHDQVQRYIKLKRKKKYEADPTTIYCPRAWCQGPARTNDSNKAEGPAKPDGPPVHRKIFDPKDRDTIPPPADRLAICSDCSFAFCIVCKASWHGQYFHCLPRVAAELSEEERASEEYMKLHSTPCPTCLARCQKSMGCNHMICYKCNSHFCYLCSAWLIPDNPYQHFNNEKSACYMRLWELEAGDGGEGVGIGFGGGINGEGGFGGFESDTEDDDDDFDDSDDDSDDDLLDMGFAIPRGAPEIRVAVRVQVPQRRNRGGGGARGRGGGRR